jgi:hypothetical protein
VNRTRETREVKDLFVEEKKGAELPKHRSKNREGLQRNKNGNHAKMGRFTNTLFVTLQWSISISLKDRGYVFANL